MMYNNLTSVLVSEHTNLHGSSTLVKYVYDILRIHKPVLKYISK